MSCFPYKIEDAELARVLDRRGYLVLTTTRVYEPGAIVSTIDDALSSQPVAVIAETDAADWREQVRIMREVRPEIHAFPGRLFPGIRFYRVTTD